MAKKENAEIKRGIEGNAYTGNLGGITVQKNGIIRIRPISNAGSRKKKKIVD